MSSLDDFCKNSLRFRQNTPITEEPHAKSYNLSWLCNNNLTQAFSVFSTIEHEALNNLNKYLSQILRGQNAIQEILRNNHRIFLIGCGASGRLSILLQRLWCAYYPHKQKQIIAVAAGGDISLIKSIEQFEDKEDFGVQQLLCQGYTKNDLVIGLSASGESPFILSALDYARKTSSHTPYLICNNHNDIISARNPKFAALLAKITTLNLDVGAMALAGSTRLQATTAMQIVCGAMLFNHNVAESIKSCQLLVQNINFAKFATLTQTEATILKNHEYVLYTTNDSILGLSILADTTERSPTFNLIPFENQNHLDNNFSPFYLSLNTATTSDDCWQQLLGKAPTCLNWQSFSPTTPEYIKGFDLSKNSKRSQGKYLPKQQYQQLWYLNGSILTIKFLTHQFAISLPQDLLQRTIVYKILLNSHSTILMGRLNYFSGNLMLTLKPSNHKLIDRAIRYTIFMLKVAHKQDISYKTVAPILLAEIPKLKPNESIILKVINKLIP